MTPQPKLIDDPATQPILDFLDRIGIPVVIGALEEDGLLPGMTVSRGKLLIDPARPGYAGDLLHEAGHFAVGEPAIRGTLDAVRDDPGEEMAAIAWSWAAAIAIGIDPAVVFHAAGYNGGGEWIVEAFAGGGYIGLPMLQWFGMTADPKTAAARGIPAYPHMLRWLR